MSSPKKFKSLAALVATAGFVSSSQASAAPEWAETLKKAEKCLGVSLAGKNDCGAVPEKKVDGKLPKPHTCSGKAASDNDPGEWVYVPVGVCAKIGGKVKQVKTF